ncbi:NAD(P)-binding protein [Aspergillus granulosus]|uniref:NAD(P)-binding protein n=1 Tax=Aspergillus granulosus TaxID=176169 RepID=A0ABR4HC04_9EURO
MARQWILTGQKGFETSLAYEENIGIPSAYDLGPREVLVKLYAASLNYRELNIAEPSSINGTITPPIVPGCDGAGTVEAVGSSVREFQKGDRVITNCAPKPVDDPQGDDSPCTILDIPTCLGQGTDGTLRSWATFPETALVHAPKSLDWLSAATLTCNWPTAWNALFGLKGNEAGPGSWVLVQGTGGVSTAVLQVAAAAGATVVATTSTEGKALRLKALGAAHVVNYRSNPNWGGEARQLTPGGRGFDFIIDIGGNQTLPQSFAAVRVDGIILVIGGVGEDAAPVPVFSALVHTCVIRGLLAGSRNQLRDVVRFIDEKKIVPAIDDVVFELAEAKSAYRHLKEKKHFAKVVIRIDHPN